MHLKLARTCRSVSKEGVAILLALDRYLESFEYVPEDSLFRRSSLPEKVFAREVEALRKLRLVERHPTVASYRLTFLGLDCLALLSLVREDVLTHIGPLIGTGKESVLYLARRPGGELVTLKLYKIGRVSFKKVVRSRGYVVDRGSWLVASKAAAEREYKALLSLRNYTELVPRAWGWNRHAVVMDYIEGEDLYEYDDAVDPEGMLRLILATLRAAYLGAGIVHADLSEYNIVVARGVSAEVPYIIDWPQYVSAQDPRADDYLLRDIGTIARFFRRKYGVHLELGDAVKYVKGLIDGV